MNHIDTSISSLRFSWTMSSEQKTDHPKTISVVKKKDEAHKKLKANTARHVVDNKVVTVTFTVFQDRICGVG